MFVNADLIAAGLSPFQPEVAAIKAARLMLREINEHAQHGESFAFETTLSGRGYLRLIREWRKQQYQVELFFLSLVNLFENISKLQKQPNKKILQQPVNESYRLNLVGTLDGTVDANAKLMSMLRFRSLIF